MSEHNHNNDNDQSGDVKTIVVTEAMVGERLDSALVAARELAPLNWSRTRIRQLIDGDALTNGSGELLNDPAKKIKAPMVGLVLRLRVPPPEPVGIIAEDIPLDILFEDETLIVLDKAAGMVVHPAAGNYTGTLVNAIAHHVGPGVLSVGGEDRPGIVHRLDKDTSGVMVVAKTESALRSLQQQFSQRSIERAYVALVAGQVQEPSGRIEGDIGRDVKNRKRMAVVKRNGKEAVTNYEVIDWYEDVATLVECRLETGRTHQIRVHMHSIGHGLIGDSLYPAHRGFGIDKSLRAFPRQALHARLLGFTHPLTGERLRFETPLADDFAQLLHDFAELHPIADAFVIDDDW